MSYSSQSIMAFGDFFSGNTRGYGVTQVGEIVEGKAQSKSSLVYGEITPALLQKHLGGELSIGIAPITDEGMCRWGAIDIDDYKYSLGDIIAAIDDFDMPLCAFYSKSKKLHLYLFFRDFVPAADVQELLKWYASAFACNNKTEIFPKQSKATTSNTFYSWINLPYFDANNMDNHRKMVTKRGLLTLDEALDVITNKCLTYEEHKEWIDGFKYKDAPPCVLSGILLRDIGPGQRNNWLFSTGVYLRLKDEDADISTELTSINASLHQPIPESELRATVLKGFDKKTYFYMCANMQRCDKSACKKREFGVDSKFTTGLDFGDLTQFETDPPYYTWIINGQRLTFWSETEIIGQTKFQALCLRQLHIVPRKVPQDRWAKILTKACENITVVRDEEARGDFTEGSSFVGLTYKFFNTRRIATNDSQLEMGRIMRDEEKKEFVFAASTFMDYLVDKNDFRKYSSVEIRTRLQDMGAYKEGKYWRIAMSAIPEEPNKPIDIEFSEDVGF